MTNPNPGFQRQKRAGLQVPAGLSPDLARFLQGLKEAVQSSQGTLGQPQERFVSVSELERLGVVRSVLKGGRAELRRVDDVDAAGNGTAPPAEDDGPAILDAGAVDRDFLIYNAVQGEWLPFGLFSEDVDWSGQHDFVSSDADQVRVGYSGSNGYVTLSRATGTTAPGYARFYDAAGVSRGYVGNHDSASRITLTSENGWGIRFASATDLRLDATEFEVNATLMDFNGSIDLSGAFFSVGAFEVYAAVTGAHVTLDNALTGNITVLAGTVSTTSPGATLDMRGGSGGFISGEGGLVRMKGGDSGGGASNGGLCQLLGGPAFGAGAGGDVGLTGGSSVAGQGGNIFFYGGTGVTHDGDVYFGSHGGSNTALHIKGDTLGWEVGTSGYGTANRSVLQTGGSGGSPSWLTAAADDRLLAQTGSALGFVQLTAGMFPASTVTSLTGAQLTFSATEIELDATLLDFNADMDLSGLIIVGDVVRLPHRSAPGSPTNGDMWTTTAGLFVRINGVTVGPLGTGSGTGSGGYPQQLGYAGI